MVMAPSPEYENKICAACVDMWCPGAMPGRNAEALNGSTLGESITANFVLSAVTSSAFPNTPDA